MAGQPTLGGKHHLPRSDEQARKDALARLTTLTEKLDAPWLLCGTPASAWLHDDSLSVSPEPPQPTYPANEPVEAIDYCLALPDLLIQGQVLTAEGSDHLPVSVRGRVDDGSGVPERRIR